MSWSISFSGGQTLSMHSLCPHGPTRIYMVFVEETPKYKLLPINSLIAEIPITKHETLKIESIKHSVHTLDAMLMSFQIPILHRIWSFWNNAIDAVTRLTFSNFFEISLSSSFRFISKKSKCLKKIKLANNSEFFFYCFYWKRRTIHNKYLSKVAFSCCFLSLSITGWMPNIRNS